MAQTPCADYSKQVDEVVQKDPQIQFKTIYDHNRVATLLREGSVQKEVLGKTVRDFKKSKASLDSIQTYLTAMHSCIFAKYKLAQAMLHESATNKVALADFKEYLKTEYIEPTYVHTVLMYALLEKYECQFGKPQLCKDIAELKAAINKKLDEHRTREKPITDKLTAQDKTGLPHEKKEIEVLHKSILEEINFSQGQILKIEALRKKI